MNFLVCIGEEGGDAAPLAGVIDEFCEVALVNILSELVLGGVEAEVEFGEELVKGKYLRCGGVGCRLATGDHDQQQKTWKHGLIIIMR